VAAQRRRPRPAVYGLNAAATALGYPSAGAATGHHAVAKDRHARSSPGVVDRHLAWSSPADLDIPVVGQLAPSQFPLGDAFEPRPLEIVRLAAVLRGRPLR